MRGEPRGIEPEVNKCIQVRLSKLPGVQNLYVFYSEFRLLDSDFFSQSPPEN